MNRKSAVYMAKNVKDAKQARHISKIMHFIRNGEECNMQNIVCCEGVMQLGDIETKNVR